MEDDIKEVLQEADACLASQFGTELILLCHLCISSPVTVEDSKCSCVYPDPESQSLHVLLSLWARDLCFLTPTVILHL